MKTALITTTINVPTVLKLYRQHSPDVAFFVAGDQKTPHEEMNTLFGEIGGDILYLHPEGPISQQYKCSGLIGFNCIQRRNIALLEAVKWGADIIVSIDDDNIPLEFDYFQSFKKILFSSAPTASSKQWNTFGKSGIKVSGLNNWFDVGRLLEPVAKHRGFPIAHRNDLWRADPVTGAKVGVAAGICLGDPDIDSVTRIERSPEVHRVSELLQSGIVVDPSTRTVFNSQNTAFLRELAPAFFMLPGVGRYDDIYASLIMQRVMRERNLHVHFGKPFVWQQRNQHNLVKDLRGEIDGMENIERFARLLDTFAVGPNESAFAITKVFWRAMAEHDEGYLPEQTIEAALAFLEDMESIL